MTTSGGGGYRHILTQIAPDSLSPVTDPLDPADLLEIDRLFSPEELALRARVRAFVDERIRPDVEGWFAAGRFPTELSRAFGELGVLGMHLEGDGCPGGSTVDYGIACMEIEAGDSGLRSFMSVQGSLVMFPIHTYGSPEQRQEWLPRLASGEAIGCFALTEPGAGSDPGAMTTSARRDGGDWILDGHKRWNTNGTVSDLAVVWARTEEGIRGFLVPSDARRGHVPADRRRVVAAGGGSQRAPPRGRTPAGWRRAAGRDRPLGPALLPDRGQVRHRVRRDGRRARLLRDGAAARSRRASSSGGRSARSS